MLLATCTARIGIGRLNNFVLAQEAFSQLLGEQNELTQELASHGMSIVYELGDAAMKKNLVNALVSNLTGSGKRKRAIKVFWHSDILSCSLSLPLCI